MFIDRKIYNPKSCFCFYKGDQGNTQQTTTQQATNTTVNVSTSIDNNIDVAPIADVLSKFSGGLMSLSSAQLSLQDETNNLITSLGEGFKASAIAGLQMQSNTNSLLESQNKIFNAQNQIAVNEQKIAVNEQTLEQKKIFLFSGIALIGIGILATRR